MLQLEVHSITYEALFYPSLKKDLKEQTLEIIQFSKNTGDLEEHIK